MARGIYADFPGLQEDDYVVYRDHRGRFRADRVGRGGTHTTLGSIRGEATSREAVALAEREARKRGAFAGIVVRMNADGSVTQIGHLVSGRFSADGHDAARTRKGRTHRRDPSHRYTRTSRSEAESDAGRHSLTTGQEWIVAYRPRLKSFHAYSTKAIERAPFGETMHLVSVWRRGERYRGPHAWAFGKDMRRAASRR